MNIDDVIYKIEEMGKLELEDMKVLVLHLTTDMDYANGDMIFTPLYMKAAFDFLLDVAENKIEHIISDTEQAVAENDKHLILRLKQVISLIDSGENHMAVAKLLADISALQGEDQ